MPETQISVPILARNEAENLGHCIASVRWADEVIVVVDASSRDATEAIARRDADRIVVRSFDDFATQRNTALDVASGDWVFALDADERVSASLAAEIRHVINDRAQPHSGYRVPIRSVILGRRFSYSGTQHDRPLRLFRRSAGRWIGAVHETVAIDGSIGQLAHSIDHQTIPDMQTFLRKIDEYTSLEALAFDREGRPWRTTDLTIRPAWTFLKLYLGKQGFRDGLEGLAFCALSGVSVGVRHWKHRERLRARGWV
jgi:glycosyltransferase involved in cell wall biosynthesis